MTDDAQISDEAVVFDSATISGTATFRDPRGFLAAPKLWRMPVSTGMRSYAGHPKSVTKLLFGDMRKFAGELGFADVLDISGSAQVSGQALIHGNAVVDGEARIKSLSEITGDSSVSEKARVGGEAHVDGHVKVYGNAHVIGHAKIFERARVFGRAKVTDSAEVSGDAWVYELARVEESSSITGNIKITGAKDSDGDDDDLYYPFKLNRKSPAAKSIRVTLLYKASGLRKFLVAVSLGLFMGWAAASAGAPGRPSVTRICSEVISRQPVKCLTSKTAFIAGHRLYANSQFTRFNANQEVSHVWYFEGRGFQGKVKTLSFGLARRDQCKHRRAQRQLAPGRGDERSAKSRNPLIRGRKWLERNQGEASSFKIRYKGRCGRAVFACDRA